MLNISTLSATLQIREKKTCFKKTYTQEPMVSFELKASVHSEMDKLVTQNRPNKNL